MSYGIKRGSSVLGSQISASEVAADVATQAELDTVVTNTATNLGAVKRTARIRAAPVGTALPLVITASEVYFDPFGPGGGGTTYGQHVRTLGSALTVTAIRASVTALTGTAQSGDFKLYKNGGATAMVATITATGVVSATGSISYVAGDQIALYLNDGTWTDISVAELEMDFTQAAT